MAPSTKAAGELSPRIRPTAEPSPNHIDPTKAVVTSIPEVPITVQRKPFTPPDFGNDERLPQMGIPRANLAATYDKPQGTTEDDWAKRHSHQTVLQQHVDFFDTDHDGIIWPRDTYTGTRRLGFGILFSLLSVLVIHLTFSYPSLPGWLPDPWLRIHTARVHKLKHGSDTGTYDTEGRFVPQRFENMFSKYAGGRDYLTVRDLVDQHGGNRMVGDPLGWLASVFEWLATYLMLSPEDGRLKKEDIRRIYDGSLFHVMAARREQRSKV